MRKKSLQVRIPAFLMAMVFGFSTGASASGLDQLALKVSARSIYQIKTDQKQKKDYIAVTKNKAVYEKLEDSALECEIAKDVPEEHLEENNMMVLSMSKQEAAQVEDITGVELLEEDYLLSANEEVPYDEEAVNEAVEQKKELDFNQWNLDAIQLPARQTEGNAAVPVSGSGAVQGSSGADNAVRNSEYTGKGIKVAVMDSGVSFREDVSVAKRVDLVYEEGTENLMFDDPNGHGSGITGMIASSGQASGLYGIAPGVELYSVKVLDEQNEAPVSRIIEGIYWCIEQDVDVINMSFGMQQYSEALEIAVRAAKEAGVILVAAAGNEGDAVEHLDYPANFSDVISVGASNSEQKITEFTAHGEGLDVAAPGEKVWAYAVLTGLTAVDGTSIATAHVTGAVALLLERYPQADAEFVKQLLKASSVCLDEARDVGLLNITNALNMGEDFEVAECQKEVVPVRQEMETYDTSGIVSGCWGSQKHGETVGALGASYDLSVAATVASLIDSEYKTSNPRNGNRGIFHGRYNYVANLHYLYRAAIEAKKTKEDLSTSTSIANFASSFQKIAEKEIKHTQDTQCGALDFLTLNKTIKEILNNSSPLVSKSGAQSTAYKPWVIMGVAVHLLGDTFAHRTIVPSNAGFATSKGNKTFRKKDFNNITAFKKKVQYEVVEFRDIKKYMKEETDGSAEYEDDINFYSNRYHATGYAVNNMITCFRGNKAYSVADIWTKNTGFQLKLNNFQAYVKSAGSNADVSQYSTKNYRLDRVEPEVEADFIDYDYLCVC